MNTKALDDEPKIDDIRPAPSSSPTEVSSDVTGITSTTKIETTGKLDGLPTPEGSDKDGAFTSSETVRNPMDTPTSGSELAGTRLEETGSSST